MVTFLLGTDFKLDKTWFDPLMRWTQQTSKVVGTGSKVQVKIDASACDTSKCHIDSCVQSQSKACIFIIGETAITTLSKV